MSWNDSSHGDAVCRIQCVDSQRKADIWEADEASRGCEERADGWSWRTRDREDSSVTSCDSREFCEPS